MNPIYRFFINGSQVSPIYKDDLAKEYELETNQRFYRAKLSGKITFVGADFDLLAAQPFDTEFLLDIHKSNDLGLTWDEDYYHAKFMKTDGQWDEDDKRLVVQPDPIDEYNDVLAGLEKEYDLVKIAPEIQQMVMRRRPLIQIYIPGDSIVSCFIGGTYWEQSANATTDLEDLETVYHFALCNLLKEVNVTVNGTPTAANGLYTGRMSITNEGGLEKMVGTLRRQGDTTYYLYVEQLKLTMWAQFGGLLCRLIRQSDGAIMHEFQQVSSDDYDNYEFDMTAVTGTGTAHGEMTTYRIYARYLLDVDTIQGLTTYPVPADDIVENNRNYRRVIGYAIDVGYISMRFSNEPTEWGLADNGQYFLPPASIFGQQFYPIARSTWRYASIWFGFHVLDWILEEAGRRDYVLRDNYPVASCIQKLLNQFAPGITHEATPDYSEFLYSGFNPISGQSFRLFVTPKNNVLVGDYDKPAQKAPTTLQQFTAMLRDCFKCFWFIDDGKFRIEHIQWFRNGGSYSGGTLIGADLTTITNVRNAKKWGFHSSAWEFDKVDLPERYQFKWMDDVTPSFEGEPMQVISKYVTAGKIEDINVSNFTTDIDYMLLNPGNVSNDGFALFAAVLANALANPDITPGFGGSSGTAGQTSPRYAIRSGLRGRPAIARFQASTDANGSTAHLTFYSGGSIISNQGNVTLSQSTQTFAISCNIPANADEITFTVSGYGTFFFYDLEVQNMYELPFVTRSVLGVDYIMQNGLLSWTTLQPNYYIYDLPAMNVLINGMQSMVMGIERKKKQQVQYPSIDDPNPMLLIKTYLGNGQVDKISINLHSRMNKVTLKYDTE